MTAIIHDKPKVELMDQFIQKNGVGLAPLGKCESRQAVQVRTDIVYVHADYPRCRKILVPHAYRRTVLDSYLEHIEMFQSHWRE
jgi:hypothetical protein